MNIVDAQVWFVTNVTLLPTKFARKESQNVWSDPRGSRRPERWSASAERLERPRVAAARLRGIADCYRIKLKKAGKSERVESSRRKEGHPGFSLRLNLLSWKPTGDVSFFIKQI
jgi:hypothetical protein